VKRLAITLLLELLQFGIWMALLLMPVAVYLLQSGSGAAFRYAGF
jgi:hypothetical protein